MALYPGAPAAVTASAQPSPPPKKKPHAAPTPAGTDYASILAAAAAPVDYSALAGIADKYAGNVTAQTIAGIQTQQAALLAQAQQRAGQQADLARASSDYLTGLRLGDQSAADFARAAEAERAGAQGYSGGLQQTVTDAAARVQANLNAVGSPQTAVNQGAAAGNALYGLGGQLPASQLDLAGPLTAASLRALPAQTLAYGQEQVSGVLGAGQQAAAALNPDILAAQAKRSSIAADYFKQLADQARQAGQDRIANTLDVLKLQQSDDATKATVAWHQAELGATAKWRTAQLKAKATADALAHADTVAKAAADKAYHDSYLLHLAAGDSEQVAHDKALEAVARQNARTSAYGAATSRINAETGQTNARTSAFSANTSRINARTSRIAATKPNTEVIGSDASGRTLIDSATGRPIRNVSKPVAATSTAAANDRQLFKDATALTKQLSTPAKPDYYQGQKVEGTGGPASSYSNTLAQVTALGPNTRQWRAKATQIVNARYGSPRKIAAQAISDARAQGLSLTQIVGTLLQQTDALPLRLYLDALARTYNRPVSSLAKIVQDVQAAINAGTFGA